MLDFNFFEKIVFIGGVIVIIADGHFRYGVEVDWGMHGCYTFVSYL